MRERDYILVRFGALPILRSVEHSSAGHTIIHQSNMFVTLAAS